MLKTNIMIMVILSFFSEDNFLSGEIKQCYILEYQSYENRVFRFLGHPIYERNQIQKNLCVNQTDQCFHSLKLKFLFWAPTFPSILTKFLEFAFSAQFVLLSIAQACTCIIVPHNMYNKISRVLFHIIHMILFNNGKVRGLVSWI